MSTLILIRHAEGQHEVEGRIGGWADFELSPRGRRQAALLAGRLAREVDGTRCLLVCSDLARAAQTADAIGRALGATAQRMPELRSPTAGVADGLTVEEARAHWIEPTEPLPDWTAYPGAMPRRQVYEQVVPCVERLLQSGRDPVIVVSHKIPISLALCGWLGLPVERSSVVWFDTDSASLTRLRVEPWGGRAVLSVNDVTHLHAADHDAEGQHPV